MAKLMAVAMLWATLSSAVTGSSTNMNGAYLLSTTPTAPKDANSVAFTEYAHYPDKPTEYFEVYSPPIKSQYSQVFWTKLPTVPLPDDIVQRFAGGKGMAVVGFEMDQVIKGTNGAPDVSIPINVAYNHHFESDMVGAGAVLERVRADAPGAPPPPAHGHGRPDPDYAYVVRDTRSAEAKAAAGGLPAHAAFGAANGGEYRKSFHGYSPTTAQLIASPEGIAITPMQIDTWHRAKMNKTGGSPFYPGPVPRTSLAPRAGSPDALYSGLLECPLTTRVRKLVDGAYAARIGGGACEDGAGGDAPITTFSECFEAAAAKLGLPAGTTTTNTTLDDAAHPPGCSVTLPADFATRREAAVTFNMNTNAGVPCAPAVARTSGTVSALVTATGGGGVALAVALDAGAKTATITLSGPDGVWFGAGFNASAMDDFPWTVVVEGNGTVHERKLATHQPGTLLARQTKTLSDTVVGGRRTVVLTRALKGLTPEHYSFSAASDTYLPVIVAIGSTPTLSYHKAKTATQLALLPAGAPVCVCARAPAPFGQGKGRLLYAGPGPQSGVSVGFGNHCPPQPRGDLLAQRNPTCDVRTYVGGQTACHHLCPSTFCRTLFSDPTHCIGTATARILIPAECSAVS